VAVDGARLEERFTSDREIQVINWDPQGRRKRGRPKRTWRRTVEGERKSEKDLERNWSLSPKQDSLEMLLGSPMLLKE
jgi:predicted ArsR family transcriptional regulator